MASKPRMIAALGARGTGKTAWAKRQPEYAKASRLVVWNLMQEEAHKHLQGTEDLAEFIRWMKAPRFAAAFYPSRDDKRREAQFDLWCRACLAAGRLTAHVEELAFVTKPQKAPAGWREMCLLGRHDQHRVSIVGTSQRPAQVDKEFLGNVDVLHCGRQKHLSDAKVVAAMLGVKADDILRMPDLHWIEWSQGEIDARRGVLTFTGADKAPARRLRRPAKGENLPDQTP